VCLMGSLAVGKEPGQGVPRLSVHCCQCSVNVWCLVLDACREGSTELQELSEQQQATLLQCYFLFSLVWSSGANTDAEGRGVFDGLLRKLINRDVPPELAPFVHAPEVGWLGCSPVKTLQGCFSGLTDSANASVA